MLGSCFTENIGSNLQKLLFKVEINPFGIIYNPISIKNSLEILIENQKFTNSDLKFYNERWFTYFHHSRFSNANAEDCLLNINQAINAGNEVLKKADILLITFGTARVYRLIESGNIVSNCHKQPASLFSNELLRVENIISEYSQLIVSLKKFNPNINIIFTISPIRHWKDGAHENQISKSTLFLAIYNLTKSFNNIIYFPAYEIFMDDLRDYRFYAEDMLHPNEIGIKYVWDIFSKAFLSGSTQKIISEIENLNQAANHRPFNTKSDKYKTFISNNIKKITELETSNLDIDFEPLKSQFINLL